MALVTLENTRLELRRGEDKRFRLFFDGAHVPGIVSVNLNQENGLRPEVTVTFIGQAVRIVEFDAGPDGTGNA